MEFQKQLAKLRKRANLKQSDLAELMNVRQYVVSSWETGRSEPNIDQLIMLSNILKVPTDYLLGKDVLVAEDEDNFKNITNHFKLDIEEDFMNEISMICDKLSDEKKEIILEIVKSSVKLLD